MKSVTINLMLATAALLVATTVASAQTMKADIPFAFRAAGTVMSPGTYWLVGEDNESYFILWNAKSNERVVVRTMASMDPWREWKGTTGGILQFDRTDGRYSLKRLWTNQNRPAHELFTPKARQGQTVSVAVIRAAVAR